MGILCHGEPITTPPSSVLRDGVRWRNLSSREELSQSCLCCRGLPKLLLMLMFRQSCKGTFFTDGLWLSKGPLYQYSCRCPCRIDGLFGEHCDIPVEHSCINVSYNGWVGRG